MAMAEVKYVLSNDNLFSNLMRDDPRLTPSLDSGFALTDEQRGSIKMLTQFQTTALLPHQRSGLMWMLQLGNRTGHGGLVLDDAGMGKSLMLCWYTLVQQLSLQLKNAKRPAPALIVVPPNLAVTWSKQFRQHFDMDRLQQELKLKLVLSTSDHKEDVDAEHDGPQVVVMSDTRLSALMRDPKTRLRCDTMVIDEAHHMQSLESLRFAGCKRVASRLTFCVTATPVVNSLLELFPLLYLAGVAPFNKLRAGLQQFYEFLPNRYHDKKERQEQMKRRYGHGNGSNNNDSTAKAKKRKRLTKPEERERVLQLVDEYVVPNAVRRSKVSLALPPIQERAAVIMPFEVERRVYDLCHSLFKQHSSHVYNTRWQHTILEWIQMLRRLATHFVLELPKLREWAHVTLQIPQVELDRAQKAIMAVARQIKHELIDRLQELQLTDEQLQVYLPCKLAFVVNELRACRCKSLVVSQWVDVAKAAAELLERTWPGRAVFFVDGAVLPARRQRMLDDFAESADEAAILVCTLRSVNEGFTITCATRLYLMDSWWNNTLEYQLFNRIYRVGQERAVDVCQLYMHNTIETRIRARKHNKFGESLATLGFMDDIIDGADEDSRLGEYIALF